MPMNPLMLMAMQSMNASSLGQGSQLKGLLEQIMQGTGERTNVTSPLGGMGNLSPELMQPRPREQFTPPARAPISFNSGSDGSAGADASMPAPKREVPSIPQREPVGSTSDVPPELRMIFDSLFGVRTGV